MGASFMIGQTGSSDSFSAFSPMAGALTGTGLGIYSSYTLTHNRADYVTTGQAQFINSVSAWSTFHGFLFGNIIFENQHSLILSSLLDATMTLGAVNYAYSNDMNSGKIALINSGGLWGTLFSLEFYYLFNDRADSTTLSISPTKINR